MQHVIRDKVTTTARILGLMEKKGYTEEEATVRIREEMRPAQKQEKIHNQKEQKHHFKTWVRKQHQIKDLSHQTPRNSYSVRCR